MACAAPRAQENFRGAAAASWGFMPNDVQNQENIEAVRLCGQSRFFESASSRFFDLASSQFFELASPNALELAWKISKT
jgi:hypothetical protein